MRRLIAFATDIQNAKFAQGPFALRQSRQGARRADQVAQGRGPFTV